MLYNKIREINIKNESEPYYVHYLHRLNKVNIGNYVELQPYSAQAADDITRVSFNQDPFYNITFSSGAKETSIDRKSFEKHDGIIYITEPMTEEIELELLKLLEDDI